MSSESVRDNRPEGFSQKCFLKIFCNVFIKKPVLHSILSHRRWKPAISKKHSSTSVFPRILQNLKKKYFGEHQITALSVEALSVLINLIENGSLLSIIREAKVCQQKPNAVNDI